MQFLLPRKYEDWLLKQICGSQIFVQAFLEIDFWC